MSEEKTAEGQRGGQIRQLVFGYSHVVEPDVLSMSGLFYFRGYASGMPPGKRRPGRADADTAEREL